MLLASVVLATAAGLLWRNRRNATYQVNFGLTFLALAIGIGLLYYTYQQVLLRILRPWRPEQIPAYGRNSFPSAAGSSS